MLPPRIRPATLVFASCALLLSSSGCAARGGHALSGPPPAEAGDRRTPESPEGATARVFDGLRHDSARVEAFVRAMPKGGDLHSHLSGAVYAERYLEWAAEDGVCVSVATLTLVEAPCDAAAGRPPVAGMDRALRGRLVDAFSMRNHAPAVENGHDRFFAAFGRFDLASSGRTGDMLADVAARAAAGHVRYLELMLSVSGGAVRALGGNVGWDDDWGRLRQRILDAGLADAVASARRAMDRAEARRDEVLECADARPGAGCDVTVRYVAQVLRAFPREQVFAQILAGFEMARADRRFVALNLVQPEDDPVAMRDYSLHMRMVAFLRQMYPDVPVSLHAGELVEGLVPPSGLRSHVREAVEVAGARRIGHGVDILQEDEPDALLREMAQRHVLVEINLTSNDVILGVRGRRHPLHVYLDYGVPVALSTDDEGVARSEMSLEYRKAVLEQDVDYGTLEAMARNSLEYAFVEGASLWSDYATLTPVEACSAARGGLGGEACASYAQENVRAGLERSLELDLAAFEAHVAKGGGWPIRE